MAEVRPEETTRPRVQSAARAMAILLAIAESRNGLLPREVSGAVGISRQATYHLLHTLAETGMVTRTEESRYVLGLRVRTLAAGLQHVPPAEHLAPLVREIADATGETSYAAGWGPDGIVTLYVVPGSRPVGVPQVPVGYSAHAHARASGKLLLSLADEQTRDEYLRTRELTRLTPHTIADRSALAQELARIRTQKYSVDREELTVGMCCLAVPLDSGRLPFTLGLSAECDRFLAAQDEYLRIVREIAVQLPGQSR